VVLVTLAGAMPRAADAEPESTVPEREAGLALASQAAAAYKSGRFEEAIVLYRRAHAANPDPISLHNIGRCFEAIGSAQLGQVEPEQVEPKALRLAVENLRAAISHYRQFLEAEPDTPTRGTVEPRIAALEAQVKLLTNIAALPTEAEARREPPGVGRVAAPWIVAGIGGATLIAGLAAAVLAVQEEEVANDTSTSGRETVEAAERAKDLALASNVLFGVGGAISVAGAVWGIVDVAERHSGVATAQVAFGPTSVSLHLRF
jgi:tetratricopeptide (TPR) repeat protein